METTIGTERERFIIDSWSGKIVPAIDLLLPLARVKAAKKGIDKNRFGYELFSGQIEDRTPPCNSIAELKGALKVNDLILKNIASTNGFDFIFTEFAEESQIKKLAVNPFDERHQEIWESISRERRLAASRVAAIHVHLQVTEEQALKLIEICREDVINELSRIGDHSNGNRIRAYKEMAQNNGIPSVFSDIDELLGYIESHNGERNVWDFVRYKPSTETVEFRMFGTTENIEEILFYVEKCLELFSKCD